MDLPGWVWIMLGLWCGPGIHCTFAFLVQKPLSGLPEDDEPIKPLPRRVKVIWLPLVLALLSATWPLVVWMEMNEDWRLVKIGKFPVSCVVLVASWPLFLWREVKYSWRRGST